MEYFVDSIVNDAEPAFTGENGMRELRVILSTYKNAEKQQLIKL